MVVYPDQNHNNLLKNKASQRHAACTIINQGLGNDTLQTTICWKTSASDRHALQSPLLTLLLQSQHKEPTHVTHPSLEGEGRDRTSGRSPLQLLNDL